MNPNSAAGSDPRLDALRAWLAVQIPGAEPALAPASADASFRRYFRVTTGGETRIAMDAPPDREDCRPFIQVAQLMRDAGLHVPVVMASDLQQGFLLLSDLGTTTYLQALTEANADALFGNAIDALVTWQRATRSGVLPPYDRLLLQREMDLFRDWYVGRHLGITLSVSQGESLAGVTALLADSALAQPAVYVHRDFMPRNLMLSEPNPGVLDFQDAVCGPIAYDVVSLFRDAFVSWDEQRVLDWTVRYWERAKHAHLPVDADFGDFYRAFEWMGLQRHLKVLGIFARIRHRDGKPAYLEDAPRFLAYAHAVCARYAPLAPLARLLDELEQLPPRVGYTF
ncbi:MAG: aminoglycoside phosphotransferase family protein [Burkholderiales bacterium]